MSEEHKPCNVFEKPLAQSWLTFDQEVDKSNVCKEEQILIIIKWLIKLI